MAWLQLVGSLKLWVSFAKETYNFREPTNRSHPIVDEPASEVY